MLVCPHCQFENPDDHRFCQKCGTSLAEKTCPTCETLVSFDAEQCPNCGTSTRTLWRAIVSLTIENRVLPLSPSAEPTTSALPADHPPVVLPIGAYLDAQQRYKLLEPLLEPSEAGDVEVQVLDCQPFKPSLLESLDRQQVDHPELGDLEEAIATMSIPTLALTYLELQSLYPVLPHLHDAWQQDKMTILLLQDRSDLPLLLNVWNDEQVLPLQILHWLHETAELWALLQPHRCAQSLLKLDNLLVDEDQLLCLQRLYLEQLEEKSEEHLELQNLGRLWNQLFQRSQRTQIGSLAQLCQELETGEVTALDQLQSRLESIANEFQANTITPSASDPLNFPLAIPEEISPTEELSLSASEPNPVAAHDSVSTSPTRLEQSEPTDEIVVEGDDTPTVVLPMKLVSLEDAGRTDIGRQRGHNEDYFSIVTDIKKIEIPSGRSLQAKGLYILCDGMGGHAGGEVASALAVDTLKQYFEANWQDQLPKEQTIREGIRLANQAIYDLNQKNGQSGSGRMGTTLVLVLIHDAEAAIAHVGDSRLYRFSRRRGLEQVTTDHEVGQREIQRGVEPAIAYARPDAYQLTQALGPRDENFINPDVEFLELNEDLLLLLCSDGLTDNDLLETHWRTHLEPLLSSQANLEQGVSQLIDLANQYNGHDNITAALIRVKVRPNLELIRR
jgi:protein phosphatase